MLLEGLKDACEESGLLAEVLAEERADEKARKICLNAVLSAQVSSQWIIPDDNLLTALPLFCPLFSH